VAYLLSLNFLRCFTSAILSTISAADHTRYVFILKKFLCYHFLRFKLISIYFRIFQLEGHHPTRQGPLADSAKTSPLESGEGKNLCRNICYSTSVLWEQCSVEAMMLIEMSNLWVKTGKPTKHIRGLVMVLHSGKPYSVCLPADSS
jgi:hypothetical protein